MRIGLPLAALALLGANPAQAQAPHRFVAETPVAREDYWQKRAAEIGRDLAGAASLSRYRVVFIGDSITDFWHLDENPWMPGKFCGRAVWDQTFGGAVPDLAAINLGVSGDRIEHVLHRLQPRAEGGEGWLDRADLNPAAIVLLVGINNAFDAEKPAADSITAGVLAVVARLRTARPGAVIVLQSLLPTEDPAMNRDIVVPVNTRLRAFAAGQPGIRFLDLYPAFVDAQGRQRTDLFNDALHPSRAGYAVWRDLLVPVLAHPTG